MYNFRLLFVFGVHKNKHSNRKERSGFICGRTITITTKSTASKKNVTVIHFQKKNILVRMQKITQKVKKKVLYIIYLKI
jgi:hypothetical protein